MNKKIFSGYKDKYTEQGQIKITKDRISHVDLKYLRKPSIEKHALKLSDHIEFNEETELKFKVRELDKGEFARRNGLFTHELISKELLDYFEPERSFFLKLNIVESLLLRYHLKDFYIQQKEFKRGIAMHIINTLLSLVIGIVLGYIIKK